MTLESATDGAIIYYTTNGNTPTASSTMYTSPINLSANTLLRAVAVKDGMANSDVMTENYNIIKVNVALPLSHIMAAIPAGTFTMGSPTTEPHRFIDEIQHQVTLSGFKMGVYQVTQELYQAVMGTNPSYFHGGSGREPASGEVQGRRPVERVSWYDALVFCNKLSVMEELSPAYSINGSTDPAAWGTVPTSLSGNSTWNAAIVVSGSTGYRLPTEAQWEYACRAGTTTAYNTGADISDDIGWYNSNSNNMMHEVGKKPANEWGLYDMHGNMYDWCWDWEGTYPSMAETDPTGPNSGSGRVVRGGYFRASTRNIRSAYHTYSLPSSRYYGYGFRLVCP